MCTNLPHAKGHFDRFSHFASNTHTHHGTCDICSKRPHLCWWNNDETLSITWINTAADRQPSHVSPVNPASHWHTKPLVVWTHRPRPRHGIFRQSASSLNGPKRRQCQTSNAVWADWEWNWNTNGNGNVTSQAIISVVCTFQPPTTSGGYQKAFLYSRTRILANVTLLVILIYNEHFIINPL